MCPPEPVVPPMVDAELWEAVRALPTRMREAVAGCYERDDHSADSYISHGTPGPAGWSVGRGEPIFRSVAGDTTSLPVPRRRLHLVVVARHVEPVSRFDLER